MDQILLYTGAGLLIFWGIAHLFPTRSVVREFGDISKDNQRILTMEWILEGATLIFVGILTVIITYIDPLNIISFVVFLSIDLFLILMAIISFMTGFKVNFLPYKLCPFIFLASGILIFFGGII
jgi:hypothetical protein